jgi:DNA primase
MWDLLHDLDLIEFLNENDINFETSGKNIGEGWVGLDICPFNGCGNYHFGIAISNKRINCWVCGVDGTIIKFLMKYFDMSKDDALVMIKEHIEESELTQDIDLETLVHKTFKKEVKKVEEKKPMPKIKLLPGKPITHEMVDERPKLRAFLKKRMISVDACIWHKFRYDYERSMRLIMPIFDYKGDIIAYQGRDVTSKAMLKYITQPKGVDLGSTLFNINNFVGYKYVIIVEGVLDAVRVEELNINACVMACFTAMPTTEQLLLLTDVQKVIVMLDHDAWTNYKKFEDLPMDIEPVILPIGKDPGSLTDSEFDNLNLSQYLS